MSNVVCKVVSLWRRWAEGRNYRNYRLGGGVNTPKTRDVRAAHVQCGPKWNLKSGDRLKMPARCPRDTFVVDLSKDLSANLFWFR